MNPHYVHISPLLINFLFTVFYVPTLYILLHSQVGHVFYLYDFTGEFFKILHNFRLLYYISKYLYILLGLILISVTVTKMLKEMKHVDKMFGKKSRDVFISS